MGINISCTITLYPKLGQSVNVRILFGALAQLYRLLILLDHLKAQSFILDRVAGSCLTTSLQNSRFFSFQVRFRSSGEWIALRGGMGTSESELNAMFRLFCAVWEEMYGTTYEELSCVASLDWYTYIHCSSTFVPSLFHSHPRCSSLTSHKTTKIMKSFVSFLIAALLPLSTTAQSILFYFTSP